MKRYLLYGLFTAQSLCLSSAAFSQGFTNDNYKKALWMTTRMYGGQRSGENNWLVYNHLPSGVAEKYRGKCFIEDKDPATGQDLSGGWHDCADHVKFGQTEFYSAYVLLKGYTEFWKGHRDYYTYDYKSYKQAGKWNWEDNAHDPNGIPDIVDEVKHATDFFIKCTPNASTFYYQVGQGGPDHKQWVTAVKMQTLPQSEGGQQRVVYKNPADASMPGFCGATLALMSRIYRQHDATYADLCLAHAKLAYAYAKAHPGTVGAGDGGFYPANSHWEDEYVDLCAELYWATKDEAYKTEALSYKNNPNKDPNIGYTFDYANNGELAWYNLAMLGETSFIAKYNEHINKNFIEKTANGIYSGGGTWGILRYNANAAFVVALSANLGNTNTKLNSFIYANIDYILGKNSQNQSFVVGFGEKSPKHPHHRNVFLNDANLNDNAKQNNMPIPAKNQQHGFLVGGVRSGTYPDDVTSYITTEGGIDYNAGLVGALGYINSILSPLTGLENASNEETFITLYPNPSTTTFHIELQPQQSAKVLDNMGKLMSEFDASTSEFGNELPAGMYHVIVYSHSKAIKTINLIKR